MTLLNIIYGRKTRAQIGGVTIDASIEEGHSLTCDITENPVEDGANITDHVHLKPAELSIQGVITDTPLDFSLLNVPVAGSAIDITGSFTSTNIAKPTRSVEQYNKLVELRKKREPFEVVTGLKVYQNMILTELEVNRNATTGKAIHFNAKMKEIKIVRSATADGVKLSRVSPSVKNTASKTKSTVQEVPKSIDPTKDAKLNKGPSDLLKKIRGLPPNA